MKNINKLKNEVFEANMELVRNNLVIFTFGNVSAIDRESKIVAIKPSGLDYKELSPESIVLLDLDGNVLEGNLRPSSDTKTHIELYKNFKEIRGVAHTHSKYATAWAQAKKPIPCIGTTHADYFYGPIPCVDSMNLEMVKSDYEKNTGLAIINTFIKEKIDYKKIQGCLVASHGPFTWGSSPIEATNLSITLEEIAEMSYLSFMLNKDIKDIEKFLLEKHFFRKHGPDSYYGQTL